MSGHARGVDPRLPRAEHDQQDEQDDHRLHAERGNAERAVPVTDIAVITQEASPRRTGQYVPDHRRGGHGRGGFLSPEATAQVLGITTQQLRDDLAGGKTLTQIAASKGISRADLISKLTAAATSQLDADLKAGKWNRSRWSGVELQGKTLGVVGLDQDW